MKKIIFLILCGILTLSCTKQNLKKSKMFYFNIYNNENIRVENNTFTLQSKDLNLFDSIYVFKNDKKVLSFKEVYEKGNGIYRFISNKKTLTHSLSNSETLSTNYGTSFAPFINKTTTLINKRVYKLEMKNYKIYHFSEEQGNHKGFDSYYLENVGFICYYNFDSDKYILCDSTNIESLNIKAVTNQLINDTTFFARYTVAKLFPKFYRKPNKP